MKTQLDSFLNNFSDWHNEEDRVRIFSEDIERLKSMDDTKRLDFQEKMSAAICDGTSYVREFAIDPVTLSSWICNHFSSGTADAQKELLKRICLNEKLDTNEKNQRFEKFISGNIFFEIDNFKTPILKISSSCKSSIEANVKSMILSAMESKKVIFLDYFGHPVL